MNEFDSIESREQYNRSQNNKNQRRQATGDEAAAAKRSELKNATKKDEDRIN